MQLLQVHRGDAVLITVCDAHKLCELVIYETFDTPPMTLMTSPHRKIAPSPTASFHKYISPEWGS